MQTKNSLPHTLQPLQLNKKKTQQTQHASRPWILDKSLLSRLPLVALLWSTCWLLTGCGVPCSFNLRFQNTDILPEYFQPPSSRISVTNKPIEDLTEQEIAFQAFLKFNELDEVWRVLQKANNNESDLLDLSGILQKCTPAVQTRVLKDVVQFILNRIPKLVALNLSNNGLIALPESLGELTQLQRLNLCYNELATLPKSFVELINLHELNLSYNELKELPDNFGNLTQLQVIEIRGNKLTVLPESFVNLTQLNRLDLCNNKLTELPNFFDQFIQLQRLDLSFNKLTCLPISLRKLTNLICFEVENNPLLDPFNDDKGTYIPVTPANSQFKPYVLWQHPMEESVKNALDAYIEGQYRNLREERAKNAFDAYIDRRLFTVKYPGFTGYKHYYDSFPGIVLIKQFGKVTLSEPVPVSLSTLREIVEQLYTGKPLFVIKQ